MGCSLFIPKVLSVPLNNAFIEANFEFPEATDPLAS